MKQFNRKMNLALLGGALLGAAMLPSAASAKPFPKRGYILKDKGAADIGRRSSRDSGNRAALRMLVRSMRQDPNKEVYKVTWEFPLTKVKMQQAAVTLLDSEGERSVTCYEGLYMDTKKSMIYTIVKCNGTFRDLPLYGAVNISHPISINLNRQPSYDAGSRVAIQVIAKSFSNVRHANYEIRWSYPLPDGQTKDVLVAYTPLGGGWLDISCKVHKPNNGGKQENEDMEIFERYGPIGKQNLFSVAKRQESISDLPSFGVEKVIGGK